MEVEELKKRISKTVDRVNNARTVSERRRYYVILHDIVSIYNDITGEELFINEYIKEQILKHGQSYYLRKELSENGKSIRSLASSIVRTYKAVKWDNHDIKIRFKNYSPKYLNEIVEDFLAELSHRYYQIFRTIRDDERIIGGESFFGGHVVYDHEELKTYVFVSKKNNTIAFCSNLLHEIGHAIQYDFTKYSRKTTSSIRYDITLEMFSMFIEFVFVDYLKRINFNLEEIRKLEEKLYTDFLIPATQVKFALTCPQAHIDEECQLFVDSEKVEEASDCLNRLRRKDNLCYYLYHTDVLDAICYMYGGVISDIFRHYFREDPSFIHDIERHFFDYEAYNSEEILDRLPHVREELQSMKILRNHLKENIKLKHQSFD